MHLICPRQIIIGGGDHTAVVIFETIKPVFQPLHRNTAQVDNIATHRLLIGLDKRAHHVLVIKDRCRLRDNPIAERIL